MVAVASSRVSPLAIRYSTSSSAILPTAASWVKWQTGKKPSFDKGGYILVDDMIISSDGEKMLYLIEPTPTEFKVLAQAELLDTKQSWAPLALSDGKLVIRDQGQMKCVLVK